MKENKQVATQKRSNKAVLNNSAEKKQNDKNSLKVVDVELSETKEKKSKAAKKTTAKKSASRSKTPAGSAAKPKKPDKAKEKKSAATAKPSKSVAKAKKVGKSKPKKLRTGIRKERSAAKVKAASTTQKASDENKLLDTSRIVSPSLEVLRPFREAAKQNRKLQREREKARTQSLTFLAKPPRKGKKYTLDLRVHSPVSQGFFSTGGVEPAPALVRLARVKGLHAIGLTDYYHAGYVDLVKEMAQGTDLVIIPGLDLMCEVGGCDGINIIALFPESHTSADLFSVLDQLHVPEWAYGRQDYSIRLPFSQVLEVIEGQGGVVIPSRIDKTPFSQLAIPTLIEEFGIHAFDLVHAEAPEFFRNRYPTGEFTFFSFSNANALGQIGSRSANVKMTNPGFEGVRELVQRRVIN